MINQFRITKYNPLFRDEEGHYLIDEWTDYSDVGQIFKGKELTYDEYVKVEKRYISVAMELAKLANVASFSIEAFEGKKCKSIKKPVMLEALPNIIKSILRSEFWCKLVSNNFFIHFGYDYYMYIGCVLPNDVAYGISLKHELYCEEMMSPYLAK